LSDDRMLIVGGWGAGEMMLDSAEVWDPAGGTFDPAGPLTEARLFHAAAPLPGGRVLVVGGWGMDGEPLASAEAWNPESGTFSPAGSLAEARPEHHTATPLPDGRVIVVGGRSPSARSTFDSAEVWDPVTASFGPAGSLLEGRYGHTASPLSDGRVLIIGGYDGEDILASAEVWEPHPSTAE
jgi:hypothetical protein